MSSDSEDDYMSESFVQKLDTNTTRPGLISNPIKLREVKLVAKKMRIDEIQRTQFKSVKHLERESREQGLSKAITAENKGFAMLTKMGYKAGQSIGRPSATGIVEPIAIQVKIDRGGLGREEALRELKERRTELMRVKLAGAQTAKAVSTDEFRLRMTQHALERQVEADLGKCQRACEKLDQEQSIDAPAMIWFWPIRIAPKADEPDQEEASEVEDEEEEEVVEDVAYESTEKLEMLTNYLRTTYCFCHWCGTQYDDVNDLKENCPGATKDDH